MTPERYSQIKNIFHAVLDKPHAQRSAYLAYLCQTDVELQAEVQELLNSDENSKTFLESPAITPVAQILDTPAKFEALPRHIGPYQVLSILGSGGMGTVCLAIRADDHYKKRVAIKLIRQGLETENIVERFRRERQIVASLEHPNIAQLLDGGATADGRPYLVMEYVEGIPIDEYCDKHKLPVAERIQLFRTVCAAVDYAHKNLVVHRDIKPGNILVREDGTVKLLDFGIAKLLTPEGVQKDFTRTATSMRLMTPQYASPEQVTGDTITTTSDVYLLGIVLYELLTGHRPYQLKDGVTLEVARVIANQEPERPSTAISRVVETPSQDGATHITLSPEIVSLTRGANPKLLRRRLEGDLDSILLKALKRKPQDRYGSAQQLSDDLRRHLESEPVTARPRTAGYLVSKFATKNRAMAVSTCAVLAVLLTAVVITSWQARVASEQRAIAQRRFDQVRKVAKSFLFEVHDAIAPVAGTTSARKLLVSKAVEYLNGLSQEISNDNGLKRELATAYQRVGDLQGNPNSANVGDTSGALASYRKALTLGEELVAANPGDAADKTSLARTHEAMGDMLVTLGAPSTAVMEYQKALALCEEAHVSGAQLVNSLQNLAGILPMSGKTNEAVTLAKRGAEIASASGDARLAAIGLNRLGETLEKAGNLNGALTAHQQALAMTQKTARTDPANLQAQRDSSYIYEDLGGVQRKLGQTEQAKDAFHHAISIRQEMAAMDPMNIQAQRDLAFAYQREGSPEQTHLAFKIFETLASKDPGNFLARRDLALAYDRAGTMQAGAGQFLPAIGSYQKLLEIASDWRARDEQNLFASQMVATAHIKLAEAFGRIAQNDKALSNAQNARSIFEQIRAKDAANTEFVRGLAIADLALANALMMSARWQEAQTTLAEGNSLVENLRKQNLLPGQDAQLVQEFKEAQNRCSRRVMR